MFLLSPLIGKVQGRPILTGPFQLESSVFIIGHLWELYVAMAEQWYAQDPTSISSFTITLVHVYL